MAFERADFESFYQLIKAASQNSNIETRCIAENFILEERLTEEREENYDTYLESPMDVNSWKRSHKNYVEQKIYVYSESPETFSDVNNANMLPSVDTDQYFVRLENIGVFEFFREKPLDEMMGFFKAFIKDPKKPGNKDVVKDFLYKWNEIKDLRPLFAGFWGEVRDIFTDASGNRVENDDWPNQLRDRFGLGHMDPVDNEPIPVLMFRYRVQDVIHFHPDKTKHVAIPTVLDGKFSPYFCPTPKKGWNSGQTMDLTEGDEDVYCEILHRFIEYKPEFLYDAGWITKSPGKTLEKARKIHLDFLMDDFENRI